jgi:sugar phosphate isomerase/epimerase
MEKIPVALQMYTLRDLSAQDFLGTLKQAAAIGFAGVELAGTGNLSAKELKSVLDDLGLGIAGAHAGLLDMSDADLDATIDYHLELGNKYLVHPWATADSVAAWLAIAQKLNAVGARCRARGLQVCYHNHAHEFEQFDGTSALEIIYANSDPANVQAELDLYWVTKGGVDPVAAIEQYADRVPLLHCKDMGADGDFAEVGEGTLPWEEIFAVAPDAGVQWYIVEQDVCKRPPLECVTTSFRNLQKMGIA